MNHGVCLLGIGFGGASRVYINGPPPFSGEGFVPCVAEDPQVGS
jgi:hypothetical protein